ncbi:MAG: DNA-binding protein WhiA [Clostridia bacterium]|nr:DNA-binding protein WhiA [Clostridia bacterium]
MSFTEVVKNEIQTGLGKKPCCRRALLFGMMLMRGVTEGDTVFLELNSTHLREFAATLVLEQFGRECREGKRKGTVDSRMISFVSTNAAAKIRSAENLMPKKPVEEKCSSCRRSFLAGVFLACGRVTDPEKQYLLEFSCRERRDFLRGFLEENGLFPKSSDRRGEKLLYFRDSTSVEDVLTLIGVTHATFTVMDKKIEHGMRNDANRLANCDANNIGKAISAARRQVELIRRLIDENKISFLPPELEQTARLRLQYEDMSVAQLAYKADPPLTKSGLHHRLRKIADLAYSLLNERKGES